MAKHEEDGDDWSDMKKNGPDSVNFYTIGDVNSLDWNWSVGGDGDKVAYAQFSFTGPLKLSLNVYSYDEEYDVARNVKVTIYKLTGKPGKYSLKALQTTTTKKRTVTDEFGDKSTECSATSKGYLFNKSADTESTYYIAVRPVNAKYTTSFNISVNLDKSCFYTQAQSGLEDNWSDMKKNGADSEVTDFWYYSVDLNNESYYGYYLFADWVGLGDAVDYRQFSVTGNAKVSLTIESSASNVQILIYRLNKKKGKYSLKSLASATVKKKKQQTYDEEYYDWDMYGSSSYNYSATTKSVLLGEGDYYICVKSKNAKKGGSADYEVSLNTSGSTFYEDAATGYVDDWTDMKENGAASYELGEESDAFDPSSEWSGFQAGWVGMGDSVDYRRLSISAPASLSLDVFATDKIKFTLYALTGSDGNYSLKKLLSSEIKKKKSYNAVNDDYNERTYTLGATTKEILLDPGEYYMRFESTNAKKGGSAYYTVLANASSTFFRDADDGWNNRLLDSSNALVEDYYSIYMNGFSPYLYDSNNCQLDTNCVEYNVYLGDYSEGMYYSNYVGYGDEADYQAIDLDGPLKLNFTILATSSNVKFVIYRLEEVGEDTYTQKTIQTTSTLSKKTLTYTYEEERYNSRTEEFYYVEKTGKYTYYGATTKTITLDAGTYYIAMHATDPSKAEAIYYNVTCNNLSIYDDECALSGPEACASAVPDMQDELAAGLTCGEALADASLPSSLPDVQEDSGLLLQTGSLLA